MILSRWIAYVALVGIGPVSCGVLMSSKEYCILINGEALCPGMEMTLPNYFDIDAGFAPDSKHWPKLKPKWHYVFRFGKLNRLDEDAAVAEAASNKEYMIDLWMAKDYCIYQNKPYLVWKWPQLVTCMNDCYQGDFIDNPYYIRQYGGDTPDFGPQDHSKKNNPLDRGLEYENFCPNLKPPVLDAPFPQLGQGADTSLEPELSFDSVDTGENMDITTGPNDIDPFVNNSDSMTGGTVDPSGNLFDSNEIAGASPFELGDESLSQGSIDEINFSTNDELANSPENLFLGPSDEGNSDIFASLDESSSGTGISDDSEGSLLIRSSAMLGVRRRRKVGRGRI